MTNPYDGGYGSLRGIRVIDLTQMLAGPFCTMMLADHGADVIKVEPVGTGDMTRAGGPYRTDDSARVLGGYFQSVNRNKRSIALDLKCDAGRDAFLALITDADILVENFRNGVMDRLGLGYERLREINSRLVYGALRGFGDERTGASPYVEWPAFDVVAQGMGGIMAITGEPDGPPTKVGPGIGDILPGVMLGFGVLAALNHAQRTGNGQFVDIALVDAIIALCERSIYQYSIEGVVPGREGNHHPFMAPFGSFPASDGHITIGVMSQQSFCLLCERLGKPDLPDDERFSTPSARAENRHALIPLVADRTARHSKAELSILLGGDIPFGPVLDIAEVMTGPHAGVREMICEIPSIGTGPVQVAGVPVKMTATPGGVHRRGPLLGEHTVEILRSAGMAPADIQRLLATGVAESNSADDMIARADGMTIPGGGTETGDSVH